MINISEAYIEFQDYIKNDIINPIPRGGLWYNLFHAGGGIYAPHRISMEKKVFTQFLLHTLRTTKNRVTNQKAGLYLKKQKMAAILKIAEWDMEERFRQYFAFFTSSH